MKDENFKCEIMEGFDHIIEEGANSSLNLRKIKWGNSTEFKLDLRKWTYSDAGERAAKGCTITEEGANELAGVLVEEGYGNTKRILKSLSNRADYNEALNNLDSDDSSEDDIYDDSEEYYDPNELLA